VIDLPRVKTWFPEIRSGDARPSRFEFAGGIEPFTTLKSSDKIAKIAVTIFTTWSAC
jgi:hypothetical protein